MPISSDDFSEWVNKDAPNKSGASRDHPLLQNADIAGMPTFARLRLQDHVRHARAPFTANLSVPELLSAKHLGYEPVAQVIGASVYHVGWQWMPNSMFAGAGELSVLTAARMDAWQQALGRMEQQAGVAGTHLVVGVRIDRGGAPGGGEAGSTDDSSADVIQVSLSGTAVRYRGEINMERPLLSTLSGLELLALHKAGCFPVGVAYGCAVFCQPSYWSTWQGGSSVVPLGTTFLNQEIQDYTEGLGTTRDYAIQRLSENARLLGADGTLDTQIHISTREFERDTRDIYDNERKQVGIIITVEAIATAIVQTAPFTLQGVQPFVPLSD